jgi:isoleucyl-tRNA synthetase
VVQQARRDAGLDVSDRIVLTVRAPEDVLAALREHQDFVAGETLADEVVEGDGAGDGFSGVVGDGLEVTVWVRRTA